MIQSLEDVERYTAEVARSLPDLAEELQFERGGLEPDDVARLKAGLPTLPSSYLEIIETWSLDRLNIGFFRMAPRRFAMAKTLTDKVLAANSEENPLFHALRAKQLIEVAVWEADPLCVGASGSARAHCVYRLSFQSPSEPRLVADSFEGLIKAATQLDACRESSQSSVEFLDSIRSYIPEEALVEWQVFGAVALE